MRPASFLVLFAGIGPAVAISRCVCRAKSVRRVVSALASESATAFCSSLLAIEPETVTVSPSATVETTLVLAVTNTITIPQTLTQVTTTTSTSTTVPAVTRTSHIREGGPLVKRTASVPAALETLDPAIASKACLCYVVAPTLTPTVTVTASTYISTSTTTTDLTASTITESPTVTTLMSTVTDTATAIVPTTVTVPGRSFSLVQTFTRRCIPFNYKTLDFEQVTMGDTSFEGAFQNCAAICASYAECTQIWVAWAGTTSLHCMTGTSGTFAWDANEIQCNYSDIHMDAWWFSLSS
ncbi:hypothetical protein QBC39DRAFT_431309 [Podospora conica]|nr:hypothetical protein QBC39DRAFT_431309 [Schizothecium conicum]